MSYDPMFDASDVGSFATDLGQAVAGTARLVQTAVRKVARDITADAQIDVAVDTGNLKSSIGHSDLRTVGASGVAEAEVGPTAEYGIWVENGTSTMGAQPYLGPAFDRNIPALEQVMGIIAERAASGN